MNINITEKFTLSSILIYEMKIENKHPNLLAGASLTFRGETGSHFSITGFTIWISKIDGKFNVEEPQKPKFKFFLTSENLLSQPKSEIIEQYKYSGIPIVEENKKSSK